MRRRVVAVVMVTVTVVNAEMVMMFTSEYVATNI